MKILVACFPKSGSTYLCSVIGNLPGYVRSMYTPAGGRREQEPVESELFDCRDAPRQVVQLHVRPSEYVLQLLIDYEVKPIVLVRNLADSLVSLAEHIKNESPIMPMAYFDEEIGNRPFEQRLKAVVDLAAPWYINFYVSWFKANPEAICTYEDIIFERPSRLLSYLRSLGLDLKEADFHAALKKAKVEFTRFNVGVPGRGRALSDASTRRLEELCSHYPDVDFRPIGIHRSRPLPSSFSVGEFAT